MIKNTGPAIQNKLDGLVNYKYMHKYEQTHISVEKSQTWKWSMQATIASWGICLGDWKLWNKSVGLWMKISVFIIKEQGAHKQKDVQEQQEFHPCTQNLATVPGIWHLLYKNSTRESKGQEKRHMDEWKAFLKRIFCHADLAAAVHRGGHCLPDSGNQVWCPQSSPPPLKSLASSEEWSPSLEEKTKFIFKITGQSPHSQNNLCAMILIMSFSLSLTATSW